MTPVLATILASGGILNDNAAARTLEAAPVSVATLNALAERQKIRIVAAGGDFGVKTRHGLIAGKKPPGPNLDSYLPLLESEWSRYPPELIQKTRLKRIVLCSGLSFAGQLRAAIPDFEHDDLYFDVVRGRHSESYARKVIHHEFYHIIDLRDDGRLYGDERWAALNPKTFKYGVGGARAQDDPKMRPEFAKIPGFLNAYSTTGVEEDKAEIFANLIVNPAAVEARTANDPVIRAKVVRMKELMGRFCDRIDDDFWQKAQREREPTSGKN